MPKGLNRRELRVWVALVGGMMSLLAALDRQLRDDYGISHDDYQILAKLSRSDGQAARMTDLARSLGFSPSRMTHAVRRFEAEGWVRRTASSRDRRGVEVRLTERGAAWLDEVSSGHLATVRALLFETLGAPDARKLAELMREVGQAAGSG